MHLQICLTPMIIVWAEREDIQRKDHKKGGAELSGRGRDGRKKRKNQRRRERTGGGFGS
ncbi:hypothetical protein NC652_035681 [Populus alba x Populus x berolinensis]|nr:hypothetical protein NC652_035173 [Populus alba x Populus x berolinensis]KAJ6876382.1 hypothetical protein NC652_035681 [Populus alba x Populus x berolinensis]